MTLLLSASCNVLNVFTNILFDSFFKLYLLFEYSKYNKFSIIANSNSVPIPQKYFLDNAIIYKN